MMLMSNKDMDTAFVAAAIREHNLEPTPETGFHAKPEYWQENERWKRVVETYAWGAVVFIADRQRGSAATLIGIGKHVDLEQGRVSTQGGWVDFPPSWYKEMAMDLHSMKRATTLAIPSCLGFRVPDHICDGGKEPNSNRMEPACAWRDRCIALQTHAQVSNRLQEDLIKSKSPEQIIQLTTRLMERSGAQPASPVKPKTQPKQKLPESNATQTPENASGVHAIVASVASEVAAATGLKVSPDLSKGAAGPTDLFLVDRTERSDYISIYQARKPKPIALASFRIRSRVGLLVQLPIPKSSPLLKPIVEADIKEWRDGAFQTAVREVGLTGSRIEHIKHIIVAIIQQQAET